MGKLFTITPNIKKIAQDAIDDIIDQLGKTCRLYYPAKAVDCVNCVYDPIGKKSSNIWRSGGPMPFHVGACPMCDGAGLRFDEQYEDKKFLCRWNPRQWFIAPGNIRIPDGYMQIKGYLTDLPALKRSEYIIVQTDISNYSSFKYKLDGEPIDKGNIVQGRYFVALLKRYME